MSFFSTDVVLALKICECVNCTLCRMVRSWGSSSHFGETAGKPIKTRRRGEQIKKRHLGQSAGRWSWRRPPCWWRCRCRSRCGRRGGRRRGCCCWRRCSAPGGRIMRSQPNARNTMLSVGNTIEAGGREVDLPGCRSEDQMFPRLSSTGSRSACPRRRLCKTPAIKNQNQPWFCIIRPPDSDLPLSSLRQK